MNKNGLKSWLILFLPKDVYTETNLFYPTYKLRNKIYEIEMWHFLVRIRGFSTFTHSIPL